MNIVVRHTEGRGVFKVDVSLYNRGDCLGIDFNNCQSQILIEKVTPANARSMIRELQAYIDGNQVQHDWISVDAEEKPEDGEWVQVIQNPKTTATRKTLVGVYEKERNRFKSPGSTIDGVHLSLAYWADIIFWKRLDNPPKQ